MTEDRAVTILPSLAVPAGFITASDVGKPITLTAPDGTEITGTLAGLDVNPDGTLRLLVTHSGDR